jgi:hypothetical protein
MASPSFIAWKTSGTYSVTVDFLMIDTLAVGSNCVTDNSAYSDADMYTVINTYDNTLHTNPNTAVTLQQQSTSASCSGSTLEYASTTSDTTYTQSSTGHFTFTHGDNVSVTPTAELQSYTYSDGSSDSDLEYGNVAGTSDAAYLTYISIS